MKVVQKHTKRKAKKQLTSEKNAMAKSSSAVLQTGKKP